MYTLFCELVYGACLILIIGFTLLFAYFQYTYRYWKAKGVPCLEPRFPLGNAEVFFPETFNHTITTAKWYKQLKARGEKFGGVWDLCRPILVIVDPEYIKDILTKDFNHFIDRDSYLNEKVEPERNFLFTIKSNKWKEERQKMTPTFTSGKMKIMFNGVVQCSQLMVDYLKEQVDKQADVDIKQNLASFTIDVIGGCIFGIESNSFKNPDSEFRSMGFKLFKTGFFGKYLKFVLIRGLPELSYKLGISFSNPECTKFFSELVGTTIEYRKKNNVRRPDFMQLLIDLLEQTKDDKDPFDTTAVIANSVLFFVAGFDTSSTTMYFATYELARNPDIQEKARNEVLRVLEKNDGKLTYESIDEMTYLRQIIDETLRLYPPVALARVCTKKYTLRDTDITIEKGTPVVISPLGLGRDPDHFPDPERFDPDRFTPENKLKRHPYAYIPFGDGPRNCIGLRFGVMQSSIGLIQILKNFRFSISPASKVPLTLDNHTFLLRSNETLFLKMETLE